MSPFRYPVERHLSPGNLTSCIQYDKKSGNMTFPYRFREQSRIHPGSCGHHAMCLVVECLYHKRAQLWSLEEEPLMVDVGLFIRNLPPPARIKALFKYFVDNEVQAETPGKSFTINQFRVNEKHFEAVVKHFSAGGVGLGLFSFTEENKPVLGEIFERNANHTEKTTDCPGCGTPIPMVHAVCVTGIGWGFSRIGELVQVFQYVDSDRLGEVNYMTARSMDTIGVAYLS